MKKIRIFCLVLAALLIGAAGLGCKPPKEKEYIFEAVGCDLSDYVALSGYSGGDYYGIDVILGKPYYQLEENVLNSLTMGYFIGIMAGDQSILNFIISANKESSCILKIRMSSDFGPMELTPTSFFVKVNDVLLDFELINLITGDKLETFVPFVDYEILTKIFLNKGANKITIVPGDNMWGSNDINAGPAIDCIKIKSSVELTWNSLWEQNKAELERKWGIILD